jgi:hypothetical protein
VFEFEIQSPRRVRLRIGRWHFRTWRCWAMRLPNGYRSPESIYAVELHDEDDNSLGQLGAFFSLQAAEACMAQLAAAGHTDVVVNVIPVHPRLQDWEFDR